MDQGITQWPAHSVGTAEGTGELEKDAIPTSDMPQARYLSLGSPDPEAGTQVQAVYLGADTYKR